MSTLPAPVMDMDTDLELETSDEIEIAVSDDNERIDRLESRLLDTNALVELPVAHTFTPGVYRRTILMPAGTLLTSRIHKTEHQYVVVAGSASVYIPGVGVERIEAPYFGITKPGTRRILYIHEDCVWATYHPTTVDEDAVANESDRLRAIEGRIIERRELSDGATTFELYSAGLEKLLLAEAKSAFGLLDSEDRAGEDSK